MQAAILKILLDVSKRAGMYVLKAILSELFIKEFIIYTLEALSNKTSNTVDDKMVKTLKKAMGMHDYTDSEEISSESPIKTGE